MIKPILIILMIVFKVSGQVENDFQEYLRELQQEFDVPDIFADSLKNDNFLLLDTREKEEFDVSHIRDAVWVGYDNFDISILDSVSHESKIIVYCSVGYRSSKIAVELYDSGYKNVYNLYGGIFNWANEGRLLIFDDKKTQNLHAYNRRWGRYITNPEINKIY